MASYTPLDTTDNPDYTVPDGQILRSDSRQLESPISELQSRGTRELRNQPSRSDTLLSTNSQHDGLLDNDALKHQSSRWSLSASTILGVDSQSIRHSIAPQWHEEKNPLDTARPFIHHRQAWRLSRLAISEFLITLVLCIALYFVLSTYERIIVLPLKARQEFNTFVTILALLLGINLAASLRSYAKLLRWRLLSYTYRPLRTFDLVLGCDSLMNVVKLLFTARNDVHPYLPSWTQILSALWLLTNLAMLLAVGMLGLNFNMVPVYFSDLTSPGLAFIPDLSAVLTGNYWRSLDSLQARGSGSFWVQYDYIQSIDHTLDFGYGRFGSLQNGTTQYYFTAVLDDWVTSTVSRVFIRDDVVCDQYPVVEGMLGEYNWFVFNDTNQQQWNVSYPGDPVGQVGLMTMANMNSTCGDGCTYVNIFMAGATEEEWNTTLYDSYYWQCNSTISPISEASLDGTSVTTPPELALDDTISRMLAGSVGWSPYPYLMNNSWTYQAYPPNSGAFFRPSPDADWGGDYTPNPTITQQVQDYISCFNMGAIVSAATILSGGVGYQSRYLEDAPAQGITLFVYWPWTYALLIGMPAGQFVALIIVLLLANNTIIRDDSHLAVSKIYFNLLKKYDLGEKGCMLHVDELVKLMDTKVAYTWRDLPEHERNGRPVGHVDVYEQPLYRFKINSGTNTRLKSRPEQTTWPQDKYYD